MFCCIFNLTWIPCRQKHGQIKIKIKKMSGQLLTKYGRRQFLPFFFLKPRILSVVVFYLNKVYIHRKTELAC